MSGHQARKQRTDAAPAEKPNPHTNPDRPANAGRLRLRPYIALKLDSTFCCDGRPGVRRRNDARGESFAVRVESTTGAFVEPAVPKSMVQSLQS
ncbi:MAG: hypothetical protein E5W04_08105 [Mesorhizobium sp.]|nr:MAG: hypothetical protein E5W04_08105 [Mesorhizobium sp.]